MAGLVELDPDGGEREVVTRDALAAELKSCRWLAVRFRPSREPAIVGCGNGCDIPLKWATAASISLTSSSESWTTYSVALKSEPVQASSLSSV